MVLKNQQELRNLFSFWKHFWILMKFNPGEKSLDLDGFFRGSKSDFPSARNMALRAEEYQRWWQLAQPVVRAGRLDGMDHGIGHVAEVVTMWGSLMAPDWMAKLVSWL